MINNYFYKLGLFVLAAITVGFFVRDFRWYIPFAILFFLYGCLNEEDK